MFSNRRLSSLSCTILLPLLGQGCVDAIHRDSVSGLSDSQKSAPQFVYYAFAADPGSNQLLVDQVFPESAQVTERQLIRLGSSPSSAALFLIERRILLVATVGNRILGLPLGSDGLFSDQPVFRLPVPCPVVRLRESVGGKIFAACASGVLLSLEWDATDNSQLTLKSSTRGGSIGLQDFAVSSDGSVLVSFSVPAASLPAQLQSFRIGSDASLTSIAQIGTEVALSIQATEMSFTAHAAGDGLAQQIHVSYRLPTRLSEIRPLDNFPLIRVQIDADGTLSVVSPTLWRKVGPGLIDASTLFSYFTSALEDGSIVATEVTNQGGFSYVSQENSALGISVSAVAVDPTGQVMISSPQGGGPLRAHSLSFLDGKLTPLSSEGTHTPLSSARPHLSLVSISVQ